MKAAMTLAFILFATNLYSIPASRIRTDFTSPERIAMISSELDRDGNHNRDSKIIVTFIKFSYKFKNLLSKTYINNLYNIS